MMKIAGLVVVGLSVALLVGCKQSPEQRAEALCFEALKRAVKNPTSAEIPTPKVSEWKSGGSYPHYLVRWDHGAGLRLQNGFGAMLDATAICWVDERGVFGLSINDVQMLK